MKLFLAHMDEQVKAGKKSEDTLDFYTKKGGRLLRYFEYGGDPSSASGPYPLAGLNAAEVDGYISQRRLELPHANSTRNVTESTIAKELGTLRAVLKLAKRRGLWAGELSALLPSGFSPEYKPRTRWLTPEELQLLLVHLTPDRAARVAFIVATSACWGEANAAQRGDANGNQVLLRGTKRASRWRTVPLALPAQQTLLAFALDHAAGTEGALFVHWQNVRRDLHAACVRAAIPVCSPNDLRRTCATWLRAAGVSIELISPVLGHTDTRMVERVYGKLPISALLERIRADAANFATGIECANSAPNHADDLDNTDDLESCSGVSTKSKTRTSTGQDGFLVCPETELNRRHGDFQSPTHLWPSPSNSPHLIKYNKQSAPTVRQAKAKPKGAK